MCVLKNECDMCCVCFQSDTGSVSMFHPSSQWFQCQTHWTALYRFHIYNVIFSELETLWCYVSMSCDELFIFVHSQVVSSSGSLFSCPSRWPVQGHSAGAREVNQSEQRDPGVVDCQPTSRQRGASYGWGFAEWQEGGGASAFCVQW